MLKRILLKPFGVPGFPEALSSLLGTEATILMLHRFAVPELGVPGHDPALLRAVLACLRKQRYNLLPLREMFQRLREGEPMRRAVAFTLDDGYFDQARVAAPVFAEFDCPSTIFATTGFVDGSIWLWWDQIEDLFANTAKRNLRVRLGAREVRYGWNCPATCYRAARDLAVRCQDELSHADRVACIGHLSREAELQLPAGPPPAFASLSWDEARQLEHSGVTFAPHTVTHPVLSGMPGELADWEICESWRRLSAEVSAPVPVFCYPGGLSGHFGTREMDCTRRLGLWAAVTAYNGRLRSEEYRSPPAIFRVPRAAFCDDFERVMKSICGFDPWLSRVKARCGLSRPAAPPTSSLAPS